MTPPELIDIGANLTNKAFRADLEQVLERARAAGVTRMVVTGTSLYESERAAEMAVEHPGVMHSTAGIHPHNAKACDEGLLERIKELAARPEVRAIGECGLDFNRDFSPRPDQKHWLAMIVWNAASSASFLYQQLKVHFALSACKKLNCDFDVPIIVLS